MRDEDLDRRTREALDRYLAVAPYLRRRRGDPGPSITALSEEPIPWGDGTYRRRSAATLYRYLKAAREQKLVGLYRRERADRGKRTAIAEDLFALCCGLRQKFPRMGSQQIVDTLAAEGVAGAERIAASTLRRWLREQHLPRVGVKGSTPEGVVTLLPAKSAPSSVRPGAVSLHDDTPSRIGATLRKGILLPLSN